jgi:hypothetical protein
MSALDFLLGPGCHSSELSPPDMSNRFTLKKMEEMMKRRVATLFISLFVLGERFGVCR